MKTTTLGLLICAVAFSAHATAAPGVTEKSSSRHTLHFSGSGERTLEVRAINGSITVQPHDGRDVEMIINKTISADHQSGLAAAEEVTLDLSDNAAIVGATVRHPDMGVCGEQDVWTRSR